MITKYIKYSVLNFLLIGMITMSSSCKKDKFSNDIISFSTDTLKFDTIFTTLGSTTKFFTIRNTDKNPVIIDEIKLAGGSTSSYRINVDGDAGTSFNNIEIPANDSIYVFVEVTVDPSANNLPFVLYDSIQFTSNNNQQQVILQAYGQNAHFFDGDTIYNNTTWNDDLPFVILNYLYIAPTTTLNINQNCTVYFGGSAALLVEGNLNINGGNDTSEAVIFRGNRLDNDISGTAYDKYPGQWLGVFFLRNSTGDINNLVLRNSSYGINVGNISTSDNPEENLIKLQNVNINNAPTVNIRNSKIYNNSFYGIFGFNAIINAENLLVHGAAQNVIGLYYGGNYNFTNCTFYAGGNPYISHSQTPIFYANNYFLYDADQAPLLADSTNIYFANSILYGTLEEEIVLDDESNNTHRLYHNFINCCIKNTNGNLLLLPTFQNCFKQDPSFENIGKFDFRLKDNSPCIDAGNNLIPYPLTDLSGQMRTTIPDVGCYEKN